VRNLPTSPGANQVKNWCKTIGIEEKLDITRQFENGEQIDIRCNVRLPHSSVHTILDNDTIKGSAKSGTKVSVYIARLPHYGCLLHFNCTGNK
jgi:hypothetical protein